MPSCTTGAVPLTRDAAPHRHEADQSPTGEWVVAAAPTQVVAEEIETDGRSAVWVGA